MTNRRSILSLTLMAALLAAPALAQSPLANPAVPERAGARGIQSEV